MQPPAGGREITICLGDDDDDDGDDDVFCHLSTRKMSLVRCEAKLSVFSLFVC